MRKIDIDEWHKLAQEGTPISVRTLIRGNSMFPLIRINKDYATISPLEERPEIGDIVLFSDPARKRYVIHRAWQVEDDRILTWGDNCPEPDGWMPMDKIWGKVILIERGKRTIEPNRKAGMALARFWHPVGKIWRWAGRVSRPIRHRIRPKN